MRALFRRIRQVFSASSADPAIDRLAKRIQKLARDDDERQDRLRRQMRDLERQQATQFSRLQAEIRTLETSIRAAAGRDKKTAKLLAGMHAQTRALLRAQYLAEDAPDPAALALHRRFGYASQHDEDGIVYSLLQTIGMPTRRLVDIGCGDFGGNSAWLLQECGFDGLLLDASPIAVRSSQRMFGDRRVDVREATVSSGNVEQLLADAGVPEEFDLLSIDVDGVDYWIWSALTFRPRLVVVEYNSAFGPDASVTIPDAQEFSRPPEGPEHLYYGASLAALAALGRHKGYRLVLTDPSGTNAFFVRDDLAGAFRATPVSAHYRMYFRHREMLTALGLAGVAAYFRNSGLPLVEIE
jgi:hypothetical protein